MKSASIFISFSFIVYFLSVQIKYTGPCWSLSLSRRRLQQVHTNPTETTQFNVKLFASSNKSLEFFMFFTRLFLFLLLIYLWFSSLLFVCMIHLQFQLSRNGRMHKTHSTLSVSEKFGNFRNIDKSLFWFWFGWKTIEKDDARVRSV